MKMKIPISIAEMKRIIQISIAEKRIKGHQIKQMVKIKIKIKRGRPKNLQSKRKKGVFRWNTKTVYLTQIMMRILIVQGPRKIRTIWRRT